MVTTICIDPFGWRGAIFCAKKALLMNAHSFCAWVSLRIFRIGIALAMVLLGSIVVLFMVLYFTFTPEWARTKGPDITGSNALASISRFVATNGLNTYGSSEDNGCWEDLNPPRYISDLPWKAWRGQQFQAKTSDGVLYILLGDAFHHDYYGVAYNPHTNHFPQWIRGFKPIGGHWYDWAQPEFRSTSSTHGRYE